MSAPNTDPTPIPNAPGRKVKIATLATYLGTLALLAIVGGIQGHLDVITSALPAWLDVIITPLIPAGFTYVTGWIVKHEPQDLSLPVKGRALRRR